MKVKLLIAIGLFVSIPDENQEIYTTIPLFNESFYNYCHYIFYKDQIVLEYGGGAVGPQCFENFKRQNN